MNVDDIIGGPKYDHHSASTINKFITDKAGWFMKVYKKAPFEGSQFSARGKAVEEGANQFLAGKPAQECVRIANELFVKETIGIDEIQPDFRASIGRAVNELIAYLSKNYPGELEGFIQQEPIRWHPDELEFPITGFTDWIVPRRKVLDCKCVAKTPSELKQDYQVQGSVYKEATGLPVDFLFVVPLKNEIKIFEKRLSYEDYENGRKLAIAGAQAIERILKSGVDLELIKSLCFPNPDAMYSPKDIHRVMTEWGM
jgi:hypothetical protein